VSETDTAPIESAWRRLARLLRRFPWSGLALQWVVRLVQPRFTAGVVGVLLDEPGERVLLVEHVFHATKPWGLPGGWINRGETPAQAVEREIYEETGLRVRAVRPLTVELGIEWRRHFDMVYLCELTGKPGPIRLSHELLDYRWTSCDALPSLVSFESQVIQAVLGADRRHEDRSPVKE
jgi:8-oxo-dGTP pyrophosphatase MutT (NUDIX family)